MAKILHLPAKALIKFGFERVKKRRKKDPEGHGQLNLFRAKGESARIVSMSPDRSPFEDALHFDDLGDPSAADLYNKAIENDDCVADAYCNLGVLQSKAGRTDDAFDCFTKSLETDPRHLESHYNLANLYFEMENLKLARQHYEIAAKIAPGFPNIYFNLGLVLAMNDHLEGAVETLDRYKELVTPEEGSKADELLASLKRSIAVQQ